MNKVGKSLFDKPKADSNKEVPVPKQTGKSIFSNPTPAIPKELQKKSIFTHEHVRRRIDVTVNDLKKYNTSLGVLEEALDIILTTNLDEMDLTKIIAFGKEVQESHKDLVEDLLKETQMVEISNAKKLFAELLAELDEEPSILGWFSTKKEDHTKTIISKARTLGYYKPHLEKVIERLDLLNSRITEINSQVDTWIVVITFFSEYKPDEHSEIFSGKLLNLLSTKQNLLNNRLQYQLYSKSIHNMIELTDTVILNEIPLWCSNQINKILGKQEIDNQKQEIINKIKQKI